MRPSRTSFRPSPALIIACVALFVALGGTALATSYVVSSNSQIGPNTVSGHKPPSGDHANIIGASVNGTDLAQGAVSAGKLATNSVSSNKIANGSIAGADLDVPSVSQALDERLARQDEVSIGNQVTLYNEGPWTLTGHCVSDGGNSYHATLELGTSANAFISLDDGAAQHLFGFQSTQLLQTTSVGIGAPGDSAAKGGHFIAAAPYGNHLSGNVMAIADGDPEETDAPVCAFTFEGLGS